MTTDYARANRQVGNWLLLGVFMTIVQIALGGITRLSGSGLSITEWEVITGSLPPLNQAAWLLEFDKYKATPQYQLLNSDFNLSDFKFIYFWEWFHRLWARLLGLVFAAGFIYFLVSKKFTRSMVAPLLMLFVLGALQGAVGWIMVQSGLEGDAVYVRPTRLALHFLFAMLLICFTWWFALLLKVQPAQRATWQGGKNMAIVLLCLMGIQLGYGALMAGHKAATAAATWPTINGYWISPPGLYKPNHGIMNLIDNTITIHFIHRGLAYLLVIFISYYAWQMRRQFASGKFGRKVATALLVLVLLQVLLGIAAILSSTGIIPNVWGRYEWLALAHQLCGMSLLLALVAALFSVTARRTPLANS